MSRETAATRRVGLLVLVAVVLGSATIFVLGSRQNLFVTKNEYSIEFENVSGLSTGSNVQLNGVNVGSVQRIVLPKAMDEKNLEVWISIDSRFEARIRQDSQARIKTLGLLGDKYVDLLSGSPAAEIIPPGGQIPAAPMTDVDRLAETGEDVVNNIATIAHQMTSILGRLERGEGLLGKLLMDTETGDKVTEDLGETMGAIRTAAEGFQDRRGAVGRLVHDRETGDRLVAAIAKLDQLLDTVQSGAGPLPALLNDAATKERIDSVLSNLDRAATRLADVAERLDSGESDALVPKLLHDEELGRKISHDLEVLIGNLREISDKLNNGNGSAARLIGDPAFADALEDILVGINESKMLRWLIRNRQKKGIEVRYEERQQELAEPPPPAPSVP